MQISQETIRRVTGEARFLRAMAYFHMLQCWKGVPYYDGHATSTSSLTSSRQSTLSMTSCAHTYSTTSLTPSTDFPWHGVLAGISDEPPKEPHTLFEGRVYLFNSQWDLAAADFEEIVYNHAPTTTATLPTPRLRKPVPTVQRPSQSEMIFSSVNRRQRRQSCRLISFRPSATGGLMRAYRIQPHRAIGHSRRHV